MMKTITRSFTNFFHRSRPHSSPCKPPKTEGVMSIEFFYTITSPHSHPTPILFFKTTDILVLYFLIKVKKVGGIHR